MRKRRSFLKDNAAGCGGGVESSGQSSPEHQLLPDLQIHQQQQQQPHHHTHHSTLPPLSDAYEKSSREFEDIFDIDIDTLPPSFFAEALGSLIGESGESSLLNEDIFLDACSSRCIKRCYSAPPSPLSGLLADFDEQSSMMDLISQAQTAAADPSMMINSLPVNPSDNVPSSSVMLDQPGVPSWASLSTNDVIDVLEAATQRLTAEQLQREATAAVEAKMKQQQEQQNSLPRPPSAPPPTTYVTPMAIPPMGSLSTRSDDAFTVDEFTIRSGNLNGSASNEWRQPRRPRSTVPTAASLIVPLSAIRQHDIVRSRLASLATRRLRDKLNRASTSSDRSPMSISSDQFPFSSNGNNSYYDIEINRRSSSSTPALTLTPQQAPTSNLATLLTTNNPSNTGNSNLETGGGNQNNALQSRSLTSVSTSNGSNNNSNNNNINSSNSNNNNNSTNLVMASLNASSSLLNNSADLYRCFFPNCTLSYDRPVRLHAHLLHHVYGMTGPYRCDVPTCSLSNPAINPATSTSSSSSVSVSASITVTSTTIATASSTPTTKLSRTFPTTKQLWGHIESAHPEIVENKGVQPVDFTALRHKAPLSCPSCDSSFVYAFQLFLHLRSVHVRPSHRCSQIAEKRSRLQTSSVKNNGASSSSSDKPTQSISSPFACRLCGFQSATMSGLLLHLQRRQHHRQAARKHQHAATPLPDNVANGVTNGVQLQIQPQPQPRLVFRGSSSFMLSHTASSSTTTKAAKVVSQTLGNHSSGNHIQAVQNGTTAYLVDANSLLNKSVLIVSSANGGSGANHVVEMAPQSSSETAAPPFYLLQRVVLVNVSH